MENKDITNVMRELIGVDGIEDGYKHWLRLEDRYHVRHFDEYVEALDKGSIKKYDEHKINVFNRYSRRYVMENKR